MAHAGLAIQAARTALGMSQEDLAKRSRTSAGYLSRVERGLREPTDRWLRDVTDALTEAVNEARGGDAA